jgi:hypothetical protein
LGERLIFFFICSRAVPNKSVAADIAHGNSLFKF